jgi:hypothetical protein
MLSDVNFIKNEENKRLVNESKLKDDYIDSLKSKI